jgi:hypothetical protein
VVSILSSYLLLEILAKFSRLNSDYLFYCCHKEHIELNVKTIIPGIGGGSHSFIQTEEGSAIDAATGNNRDSIRNGNNGLTHIDEHPE